MIILAVDDERIMLKELTAELRQVFPDAEIQGFQDSLEAEAWAAEQARAGRKLDYAFLDIQMREMSGLALARRLKLLHPGMILIFCTAYTEYAFEAVGMYAKGYFIPLLIANSWSRFIFPLISIIG